MTLLPALTPHKYQEEAIAKAIAEPTHGVLVASGLGAGKTLVATEIVRRLGLERVLIIAPRNALKQWADRVAAQSEGGIVVRRLDSTVKGREAFADFQAGAAGYYCATIQWLTAQDFTYIPAVAPSGQPIYKMLKGEVKLDKDGMPVQETERIHLKTFARTKPVDGLIFDEFHAIQNRKAISGRTLGTIRSDWKIGMSGTWHGNSFSGAWATSKWVWPGTDAAGTYYVDHSYHRWVALWCSTAANCPKCFEPVDTDATRCDNCYLHFSQSKRPVVKVVGEREAGAFVATLPCYVRDLPFPEAPKPVGVYVDISTRQREQYEQLEADSLAWVRDHNGDETPMVADIPIVLRQRLRTAALGEMSLTADGEIDFADDCESAKLTALRGVLDKLDADWGGKRPVLIFTDSKPFARVTQRRMASVGYNAALWTGDVSQKVRDGVKEAFIAGEVDYIVATIPSLSEAVDGLQHRCSAVVWLSRSENQLLNDQSGGRVWRPGVDMDAFVQIDILARDTLDTGTFMRLAATKQRNLAQMASV